MDERKLEVARSIQRQEITEYRVYTLLAERCKDQENAEVLRRIASDERRHAEFWASQTHLEEKPVKWKILWWVCLASLLGLTFTLKLMERNEGKASKNYVELTGLFPEASKISEEEEAHERALLNILNEERLQYVGSIVLGLNDALVELTGSLAGFTLALGGTRAISLAGLVTGIAAALSMAASDYLSTKAEGNPLASRSALYTGIAYIVTVILLILPFLLIPHKLAALGVTLAIAVLIIFFFNYYVSLAKDLDFKARFWEMTVISLGVAAFSFLVGFVLKLIIGVDA